jgi:hypothetical protein
MAIYEVVRTAQPSDVSEDELLTIAEAAELTGLTNQALGGRLDTGSLRWFQRTDDVTGSVRRYVLRSEVMQLKRDRAKGKGTISGRRGRVVDA